MSPDIEQILLENERLIFGICRTFYKEKADQEDLFQEIIIRMLKSFDSYRGNSKLSTWLYRIGMNTAITYKKQKQRYAVNMLSDNISIQGQDEGYVKGESDIDFLYRAIEKLNKIEKAIIHLYLEENTYAEIAEITGISEKNVSVKIVRIKRKLKDIILELQK